MEVKPLLYWRVYCDPRHRKTSPFFWVTLWHNMPQARQRMLQMDNSRRNKRGSAGAAAACYSWETRSYRKGDKGKLMPEMGEIILPDSRAGSGTISHECTHAALFYLKRLKVLGKRPMPDDEECLCLTVGFLTRQIVKRICSRDARIKKGTS